MVSFFLFSISFLFFLPESILEDIDFLCLIASKYALTDLWRFGKLLSKSPIFISFEMPISDLRLQTWNVPKPWPRSHYLKKNV